MFVGTSNQLGEFESGLTAAFFGVVPAVLIGGVGTIVVVLIWMRLFPQLLRIDSLKLDGADRLSSLRSGNDKKVLAEKLENPDDLSG
jgi:hypothetical protein